MRVTIVASGLLLVLAAALSLHRGRGADATGAGGAIAFQLGTLNAAISSPTSLAFGPDGRLYVASLDSIRALALDPVTKEVLAVETIASGLQEVLGLAFDPTAPPSPVVIYASGQEPSATDGYEGVVSTFTAPTWQREDLITGLPSSAPYSNHLTNGLAFDALGRLYIAQGSSTDAGLAGPYYPETPLSAAILRANVNAPGFDGTLVYDPPGTPTDDNVDLVSGDVSVFASGVRNAYDLVLHSNGLIYATDNGPAGSVSSTSCASEGGPVSAADELNLIEEGNYYGFPNRNRGRSDGRQCAYRAPEDGDGNGATGPIAVLPEHCSCDGIAEYTGSAFGGEMTGDLLVAQFVFGSLARVRLAPDGRSVPSHTTLFSGMSLPLDVTTGPDGTIYIAEFGGNRIRFFAPDSDRDGCADPREAGPNPTLGGLRSAKDFWDFFDTPGPGNFRDQAISIADIGRIVGRFGSVGAATSVDDALTAPPAAPAYHAGFDRRPSSSPLEPWLTRAADGFITVQDISVAVRSFGHQCYS